MVHGKHEAKHKVLHLVICLTAFSCLNKKTTIYTSISHQLVGMPFVPRWNYMIFSN
jgi:hypothetical protein